MNAKHKPMTTPKPLKKIKKQKMFAVYSRWGFHAFYQDEAVARKHWKNSKKYDIYYHIYPITITHPI